MNIITFLAAGFIPLIVGFLWYSDAALGKIWKQENKFTDDMLQANFNPLKVFGFSYLFGVMLAFGMMPLVIHQMGLSSTLADVPEHTNPSTEVGKAFAYIMDNYGMAFRTFKHGALHGVIYGVFLVLPLIAINAFFERKSWRYIFIHVGYWTLTFALVGGVVSAWGGNLR